MTIELMNKEQLRDIYETRLLGVFPDEEVKPLNSMYNMIARGNYEPLLIYENDEPVGYVLMTIVPGSPYLLLDYLSVFEEKRNQKVGSRILSLIKEYYSGKYIFIESENPDYQDDASIPLSRLEFYKRNGCKDSCVLSEIWGVHYINFYLSDNDLGIDECEKAINIIYETMMIDPIQRKEKVIIYKRNN